MFHVSLRRFGRPYRRFRYENQYDSPLLIFFCDTCINLLKLALIGAIAWVIFTLLSSL